MSSNTPNWKNINDGEVINYQPQIDSLNEDVNKLNDDVKGLQNTLDAQQELIEEVRDNTNFPYINNEIIDTLCVNLPNSTDGSLDIHGITDSNALTDEYDRNDLITTSACFREFFNLIYPVGSIKMCWNEWQGTKEIVNGQPQITWLFGSVWKPAFYEAFVRGTTPVLTPDTPPYWTLPTIQGGGGQTTHNHEFQIAYTLYNDMICGATTHDSSGNGGINTYNHATGQWTHGYKVGDQNIEYQQGTQTTTNSWLMENDANTSYASNYPPYYNAAIYIRVA